MMFGTNDALLEVWDQKHFFDDYLEMIKILKDLKSKPQIYLVVPPPLEEEKEPIKRNKDVINSIMEKLVKQIASKADLP
jgi:uncharacterized Fe-S cluster-containing MiaB family protein